MTAFVLLILTILGGTWGPLEGAWTLEVASVATPVAQPVSTAIPDAFLLSFFEPEDASVAARIRWCESRGQADAQNPASSAAGHFQVIRSTWEYAREHGADVEPFEVGRYDPVQNTTVAAWLRYEGGGWGHWNASAGCWEAQP